MHRVELKAGLGFPLQSESLVPNAPCGVESFSVFQGVDTPSGVPNAPCGVERLLS